MIVIKLDRYTDDPRVKVRNDSLIDTTNGPQLRFTAGEWEVWLHGDTSPAYSHRSLSRALSYVLGTPAKVGPDGYDGWLHTDGHVYLHDPATSAYVDADRIRVGDVIAYAGRPRTEVLKTQWFTTDFFGRRRNGFWVRRLDTGEEGAVPFGDNASFPVEFRN